MGLRERFLTVADGDPVRAAAMLALALMRGEPATFKAGYSWESALLAAVEMYPEAVISDVRAAMERK